MTGAQSGYCCHTPVLKEHSALDICSGRPPSVCTVIGAQPSLQRRDAASAPDRKADQRGHIWEQGEVPADSSEAGILGRGNTGSLVRYDNLTACAVKIQAAVRGRLARKSLAALKIQSSKQQAAEEALKASAVKIQAVVRGRMVRKSLAAKPAGRTVD